MGKTPAFDVTDSVTFHKSDHEIADIAQWVRTSKEYKRFPIYLGTLFPGQQPYAASDEFVSTHHPNQDPGILNGTSKLYLIGQVSYMTFGRPHITRFCGLWVPKANAFDPGDGCKTWDYAD